MIYSVVVLVRDSGLAGNNVRPPSLRPHKQRKEKNKVFSHGCEL